MKEIAEKEVHYSIITWMIENIGSWNNDVHGIGICSPLFILNNLEGSECELLFIKEKQDEFDVCLFMNHLNRNVRFLCIWSLMDENGNTVLSTPLICNPTSDDRIHAMFKFSTLRDITLYRNLTFLANGKLTVRLTIVNKEDSLSKSECIAITTRLLEKPSEESFVWRIEKLCTWQLKSEATATVRLKDICLKLRIFMTGESLDDAVLNFGISTENANLKSLKVKISFFNDLKRCVEKKYEYHSTECKTFVVSKLVSRCEILEALSDCMKGDDLTFLCKFEYDLRAYKDSCIQRTYLGPSVRIDIALEDIRRSHNAGRETKQCPKTIVSSLWNGEVQTSLHWIDPLNERGIYRTVIGEDFFSAYREHILCDFELLAGEESFQVHKVVLCARSQLFRTILSDDGDTKLLRVPDMDADTLGRFVAFLYSGKLTDDPGWWRAAVLYEAADKYEVPTLKLECSEVLRSNIAVSNVCDALELAERFEDKELMDSFIHFIEDNFEDVIFSDEWDRFLERSHLAGKTMIEICKRKTLSTLVIGCL